MLIDSVQREFEDWIATNEHVYEIAVRMTRKLVAEDRAVIGIADVIEALRWHTRMATSTDDYFMPDGRPLKIPNAHRARLARRIMEREPDLADVFRLARLRTKQFEQSQTAAPGEQATLFPCE